MKHQTEAIWTEFSNQLKQFILGRVVDKSLADDILQDVFVKIHSRLGTLKDDTKIQSWIYQIARNTIVDHYRTQKTGETKFPEPIPAYDETPDDIAFREAFFGLREMIEELPEPYCQALILTEYEGFTQKELAEKLGISISGAKSRVQRARKLLKNNLLECCHFEFDRYGTVIDYHPGICASCSTEESKQHF